MIVTLHLASVTTAGQAQAGSRRRCSEPPGNGERRPGLPNIDISRVTNSSADIVDPGGVTSNENVSSLPNWKHKNTVKPGNNKDRRVIGWPDPSANIVQPLGKPVLSIRRAVNTDRIKKKGDRPTESGCRQPRGTERRKRNEETVGCAELHAFFNYAAVTGRPVRRRVLFHRSDGIRRPVDRFDTSDVLSPALPRPLTLPGIAAT